MQGEEGRGCTTSFNLQWLLRYRHPTNRMVIGGKYLPRHQLCGIQAAWSIIGTPAHEGSKTCRRITAQRTQHKVAAEGVWTAGQRFTAYEEDELHNVM